MSFIYPRVVIITRSAVATEFGKGEYSGESSAKEQIVAENIPASIQLRNPSGKPETGLPGDTSRKSNWRVLIPLNALGHGVVKTRDIITDDLGERYQVSANYYNSLGANFLAEKLET